MLLEEYAHECTILTATREKSSEGGWKTTYTDGETFANHMSMDSSPEMEKADQEGIVSSYTGLIDQSVKLEYGDYFRDNVTGITYRVTSNPEQRKSPASATLSLKRFTAEKKEAPT